MNSLRSTLLLASACVFLGASNSVLAGTAEEDWQAVTALDGGPTGKPESAEAVGALVINHLAKQEKVLRAFLADHADDSRAFEAQLRLARLLQLRADFENSDKLRAESKRILDNLDKTATPEQRPELEFSKVARMMRLLKKGSAEQRDDLLKAARRFETNFPDDRRVAALLAEVATLFDTQPKTKEQLLEDALRQAKDPDLRARITDDLKRVRLFGQEVPLAFTSVQGQEINVSAFAGKPVFIIFFAQSSPPAMAALAKLQQEVGQLPQGSIRVIGVNLDPKREMAIEALKTRGLSWPTACDGQGWESPLVRGLGINTLPTVWLLDAKGRLRSLNALDGAATQARQLIQGR
jgi:hypothetical protein